MERHRTIPQALLLLLLSGIAVAQTQASQSSPVGETKPRRHQSVDNNPTPKQLSPQVVPGPVSNQKDVSPTPTVQNPAGQQDAPPVVLPPSQMPPSPPRSSYVGGKLTVVANNSTLDDVLTDVGKVIGADVQRSVPGGSERVFGQFGPASPAQVLNALLRGSRYDFVIVGSADGPDLVRQIILTPNSSEVTATESVQAAPIQSLPQGLNPPTQAAFINQQRAAAAQSQEEQGFPPGPGHPGPGARQIFRNPRTMANSPGVPQQVPPTPAPQQ
jgi:hypothetical protein